jgi:hypothetical protein
MVPVFFQQKSVGLAPKNICFSVSLLLKIKHKKQQWGRKLISRNNRYARMTLGTAGMPATVQTPQTVKTPPIVFQQHQCY